jgi:hypothetical protein
MIARGSVERATSRLSDAMNLTTPDEIRKAVEASGDVLTLPMEAVRDAFKYDRLGRNARTLISNQLEGLGLGHFPTELPDRQWIPVRLFKLGSPMADLIDAALHPSEEHDQELRNAVTSGDSETIKKIKALLE